VSDDRTSKETGTLIEFVTNTASAELPPDVLHESKRCLLDFLGLAIGASGEPAVKIARHQSELLGGAPQAFALGTGVRLRATDAALVNGIAAHVFDFDDTHLPTILHPSTPLYAAGVALAQWRGHAGLDLLASHALGYELSARVSLALYPEHYDVGWHMTGTTGPLGAAAASARLLGLDASAAVHCIGLAATQASGHREQFGTMAKPFHAGHAASAGVLSALLAADGFTAAPDPLQGRRGMFAVMSTRSTPDDLTDGLGDRWEIFRNGVKPYACGVVTHPPIDAVRHLRTHHGLCADDIAGIDVRVHSLVPELTGKTEPRTGLEGKFSVQFACAIALLDGTAGERQFSDHNVARADVQALMRRIVLVPDASIEHTQAVALARTRDGREVTVTIEHATGTPENRIGDDELAAKFHDLADPVIGSQQAAELEARVWEVDRSTRLDDLLDRTVPSNGH
jgi:2-methylcitrate dehydratase PrpD